MAAWSASKLGAAAARPRRLVLGACAGVVALGTLAACTTGGSGGGHGRSSSPSPQRQPSSATSGSPAQDGAEPAVITATPAASKAVNPTTPVTVSVADGTLSSVKLVNPAEGKTVTGTLSADSTSWHSTEVLGYGKTYRLTAKAVNGNGVTTVKKSSFTTLTPSHQTMPYLDDLYGASIKNHGTYGVAMVVNVVFDEAITDRAAAERALRVTTSPQTTGSWSWVDSKHVHWRPEHYFQPGTKVTVAADEYGVKVGAGLYGQSDVTTSFTIGRKQVTIADDRISGPHKRIKVYRAGKLVRSMYTAMGEHSGETVSGNYINFYTLDGTYTVLGFENPAHMCSDTYGLPADALGGYPCEDIPWSTKISTDGIYLHELNRTRWAQLQGEDVSHGCLNLDTDDAHWFFTHSLVGDPVKVLGAKGAPKLQIWQGGDWTVSWTTWLAGSALR